MRHHQPSWTVAQRSGTVLIVVAVLLLVTAAIAAAVLQAVLLDARQHQRERFALQADRLAEAGLARAAIRRASDPAYDGETWQVELAGDETASVAIRIIDGDANPVFEAVATFPADSERPVRSTRRTKR